MSLTKHKNTTEAVANKIRVDLELEKRSLAESHKRLITEQLFNVTKLSGHSKPIQTNKHYIRGKQ